MRTISKNWDVTRQVGGEITDGRIAGLVALSSIFAKWVGLQWGIVAYERGWYPKTEPRVLEHQMALRQLLLRFWVTDHGDCHFREESLEKVTVVTSKRRVASLNIVLQACSTRYWVYWVGGPPPAARHRCTHFAIWLGEILKMLQWQMTATWVLIEI